MYESVTKQKRGLFLTVHKSIPMTRMSSGLCVGAGSSPTPRKNTFGRNITVETVVLPLDGYES